ncbi:Fibronectin type III,Protein-tyrosine phosphatase-like,PTP type protein phosphatase,Tyrosine [Cinara cedri]|uniref:protein-tyrosine-phosphatase n=1 Tax=Cinara cedri TaxID=506608 RepID=A0A5E4NR00_9HEMI|nr:Fibronectin type III,Protein-tyrosine phosphatase-like,PTP type protein phosphatase,Tyrosine [Cinara cedri]
MNLFSNFITILTSMTTLAFVIFLASGRRQSGDSQRHVVKLNVESVSPTAFYIEWTLQLPDVNTNIYYYIVYSSRFTSKVKFTIGNNLTLTDLTECTAYTITVMSSLNEINNGNNNSNAFCSPYASANVTTSHNSRLKTVENLTTQILGDFVLIAWESPAEQTLCTASYNVSSFSTRSSTGKEVQITESNHHMTMALEPCVTYYIDVWAIDFFGRKGNTIRFNIVGDDRILDKPANGRVLFSTNHTATLQWDPPVNRNLVCDFIHRIVNCSYSNTSLEVTTYEPNQPVVMDNLQVSTKYTCHSAFFNKKGYSAKSDDIIFWTKLGVPDTPKNVSTIKVNSNSIILTWTAPTTISPANINSYRLTVEFKNVLHEIPDYCLSLTEEMVTYYIQNDMTNQYEIKNLRPDSQYYIELSAATESGFGNSTNITINTLSSISSSVENLKVTPIKSNLNILSWKYPCIPNGKIKYFYIAFVGERVGYHNHIFNTKFNISGNEKDFELRLTNLLPEYTYLCTIKPISYAVETSGQEQLIRFSTQSTSPGLPLKYDTFRRLRVTVSESYLTQVRLSIPGDLFSNANGNIQYYSIIVYQDGGFPDKPERGIINHYDVWPPVMRSWAEASPYPFILPYQTTPDKWMPFKNKNDAVFDIGIDEKCSINDEQKNYCNGPLRPVTDYRLKLRAFTSNGYQDSWTVPFTTPGKPTAVYYLVLCSILFAIFITAAGMYYILNEKVPWAIKYKLVNTTTNKSDLPGDMSVKQLLDKKTHEIEAEYDLLSMYLKSNPSIDVATIPQNKFKNRYSNVLPYDYNRVTLKSSENDYINASFIEDSKGIRKYIACQGPTANTCIDMWQMILDQDVASIVMLCQTIEKDKIKCEKYFPNSKEKLIFGEIIVKNDITIVNKVNSFTTRIFTLIKGDLKKTIRHFQFHDWPDFGTPNSPSTLGQFCQVVQSKSPMGLIVVHCSAGVGRTGTYIACDMLLRQIQDRIPLNIFKTVLKLREQRANMVQTQAQYEFVYDLLAYYVKQNLKIKSLITNVKHHNSSFIGMDYTTTVHGTKPIEA